MTRARLLLGVAALLLTVAVAVPVVAAVSAPPTLGEQENKAFTTQQRNHFGDPTKGFVVAEEWAAGKQPWTAGSSLVRGCSRWFVAFRAKRVLIHAVRVRDADTFAILQTTTTSKNSSGAPLVQLCTDAVAVSPPYYVDVVASIRWADDTLSSRVSFGSTIYNPTG